MVDSRTRWTTRRLGLSLTAVALSASLAACGSSGGGSANGETEQATQEEGSTITVWVDQTRTAAMDAFEEANPDVKVDVVTYDGSSGGSNSFKTKMALFDRAGKGWPDVVFSSQNNDAAWASQGTGGQQAFAAQLDDGLVDDSVIDGFSEGALDPCTVEDKVYCLRNDLAPNVLWYDQKLFDEFGYDVPTTWEEYQAIGEKVAQEHPGFIVGSVGDGYAGQIFMWAAQCEAGNVTGPRSIEVDVESDNCTRAADMVDTLVGNESLTPLSVFTPEFVQKYSGKVLMMPGPAWYSGAIFNNKESLNVPAGQIGAAAPLAWDGEDAVTGNVGGGTWFVSSHSKNLDAATKVVDWVTSAPEYQVELAPGFPATTEAQEGWIAKQEESGYFSGDLSAIPTAGTQVWSGWGSPEFSQEAVWAKTITPILAKGGSLADALPDWQTAIEQQAQVDGYQVN